MTVFFFFHWLLLNSENNKECVEKYYYQTFTMVKPKNLDVTNYEAGDIVVFDNTGTNGGGISAFVDSVIGKPVENLSTYASFPSKNSKSLCSSNAVWDNRQSNRFLLI